MPDADLDIAYVFGYGSLVGEPRSLLHGGATYAAIPGRLPGFRRLWGVAMNNWEAAPSRKHFVEPGTQRVPRIRVAFLDLEKSGGAGWRFRSIPLAWRSSTFARSTTGEPTSPAPSSPGSVTGFSSTRERRPVALAVGPIPPMPRSA